MVAGTTGLRDSWPVGSVHCWNEPLVGVGCGYAAFHPLVCFLASITKLGGHVDAPVVVVCKRIQSVEVEKPCLTAVV